MGILNWIKSKLSAPSVYSGGIGSASNSAIVINLTNSLEGITAEYAYVSKVCGEQNIEWRLKSQSHLSNEEGREFDVLTVVKKDGSVREFWFDITAFYGKF